MSTEIDIISNIPINYVMVDHFAKNIGLSEQKMNKLKKHAYQNGCTYKAIERKKEDKVWNTRVVFRDPLGNLTVNIIAAEKWIEEGFKNGK